MNSYTCREPSLYRCTKCSNIGNSYVSYVIQLYTAISEIRTDRKPMDRNQLQTSPEVSIVVILLHRGINLLTPNYN